MAVKDRPKGTGHAVLAARDALAGFSGDVLVTYADCPLLTAEAVAPLFARRADGADVAVLGFRTQAPAAYGRLILGGADVLLRIVEARDATAHELAITACNSGVLAASAPVLFNLLSQVENDNAKGEYYLTDVVGLATEDALSVRVAFADESLVHGVNSQAELASVEVAFQTRRRGEMMAAGVTMTAPQTVFLARDTRIAPGAVIEPNVVFAPGVSVD